VNAGEKLMHTFNSTIEKFYNIVVACIATAIFSILLIMSFMSTCYLTSEEYEITFYCKDNYFVNTLFLVCSIFILWVLKRMKVWSLLSGWLVLDSNFKRIKALLWFCYLLYALHGYL